MFTLRSGLLNDLEFLVLTDLKVDGYHTDEGVQQHRDKIAAFIKSEDKGVFIIEEASEGIQVAIIMYSIRQVSISQDYEIFHELNRNLFPADGRFIEIFQLWVDPRYRRKGLATKLKRKVEEEAISQSIGMIYTHTEESNTHVIKLNELLGYRQVRIGPIWDEVSRVSLIKNL